VTLRRILALAPLPLLLFAQSSTREGVYTAAQAVRGKTAYKNSCAACHGEALEGAGQAPPLAGEDFIGNWSGQALADLFDKIQTSMPADRPGQLSAGTNSDIVAYLLSANKFPAGRTELSGASANFRKIRFEKP
jgi:cytochrome c